MLIDVIFLIVLVICFITDVREQKIYNKVVLPSIIIVIILNSWIYGFNGLKLSILGFLAGMVILLIPYMFGGMGAGDVKLLAFVGAAKGVAFVFNSAIYMAFLGGVISLAILINSKQAIAFLKSLGSWVISRFYKMKTKIEISNSGKSSKFPYGTVIVAGALICLFFKEAWVI